MNALPDYLRNRSTPRIADQASEGMGSALPPHISIKGNCFTLIDKAGAKQPLTTTYMDCCVIDVSKVMCKQFYEQDWGPNSDNPPDCFSANGIAPSREASKPQAATCAACEWNVRGSDTSALSGKPIKACRDEKWIAIILLAYPQMIFQMKVTPGSFKAWKAYTDRFTGQEVDLSDVVTRIAFEAGKNGVLTFEASTYIEQTLAVARNNALQGKLTDVLVGRTDQPRLAGPLPQGASTAAPSAATQQQVPQGAPLVPFTPATPGAPASVTTASPTDAAPARRRRRSAATEQEAAPAAAAPAQAPFRPANGPLPPQQEMPFGVGQGAAPDPALAGALQSVFGKS